MATLLSIYFWDIYIRQGRILSRIIIKFILTGYWNFRSKHIRSGNLRSLPNVVSVYLLYKPWWLTLNLLLQIRVVTSAFLSLLEYGEKQSASAFWNGELEAELRELGSLDFFGMMKKNEDREKVMEEVDKIRAKGVYRHSSDDCSDACKARGKF